MQRNAFAVRQQHNGRCWNSLALHHSRRSPSARADLSSDKERLGNRFARNTKKNRALSIDLRFALDASARE
jgi:hypothetical protein